MRTFIFLVLVFVLLAGCASLTETLKGIASDPIAFHNEAAESAADVKDAVPELPFMFAIGIGYAASFLRRLYKNRKIQKAKDTGRVAA